MWCYFSLVLMIFLEWNVVRRGRGKGEEAKCPLHNSVFGGKVFITKNKFERKIRVEYWYAKVHNKNVSFKHLFRYSLLLTCSFLLPPEKNNHKTAQNFFWVYVFVCLIHLILFMAHFFASNWESKKTILLLVLLLNFNISPMIFFSSSFVLVSSEMEL